MEKEMLLTFIILIVATILFIHGRLRSDLVALGSLISLTLLNIITPSEALAGFSNSVVVMIAGLFVVGAGIFNTGLADRIGHYLIKIGGNNENRLFFIILLTVGIFSAFMSNTGTVAVLLPVVVSVALTINVSPAKFLMPLAFASSIGGMLTIIGTPPNLVASQSLVEGGYERLHFFQLTPIGLIALFSGILFLMTVGKKLLPQSDVRLGEQASSLSVKQLAGIYKVYHSLHLIRVPSKSKMIGQTLQNLDLTTKLGITVVAIEKNGNDRLLRLTNNQRLIPKADTVIEPDDVMLIFSSAEKVNQLVSKYNVEKINNTTKDNKESHFLSRNYGITEILVAPQSTFINKTIRELHFRKRLKCTVLAIYRNGRYIQTDVGKQRLRAGDALLIHGLWEHIELLAETSSDVVVVGRVSDQAISAAASGRAPIAGLIMLIMLLGMTLELFAPVIMVLIAAFLMLVTGCLRSTEDAYRRINWETVILIAAMLPLATALEKTGGVVFMSDSLINLLGDFGPYAVLGGFYVITMLLSQFISNTATAVIFVPIAIQAANTLSVSPYPFVICVAIAASMAFSTPVASPTNALVMNAGGYQFKDYVKVGVPLQLFLAVIMMIFIPLIYPF